MSEAQTLPTAAAAPLPAETSVGDILLNSQLLEQVGNLAAQMATAKCTLPEHLQGSEGDCYAVVMQAVQWRMNPYAVAQKTHLVNGTLGYEAQLVNAVITSMAPTKDRLNYEWFGDWKDVDGKTDKSSERGVKVWATMKGEEEPRVLELSMAQVGTVRNSPLWVADPRQQIAYLGVKRWGRLHCPDVLLGVYTPDELEEMPAGGGVKDVSPAPAQSRAASIKDKLRGQKAPAAAKAPDDVIDAEAEKVELTLQSVKGGITAATDPVSMKSALADVELFLQDEGNEQHRDEISQLYQARVAELKGGDSE